MTKIVKDLVVVLACVAAITAIAIHSDTKGHIAAITALASIARKR